MSSKTLKNDHLNFVQLEQFHERRGLTTAKLVAGRLEH